MNFEQAKAILCEDDFEGSDDWDYDPLENDMVGKRRWSVDYSSVFRNNAENTFWRVNYGVGATEYEYEGPEVYSIYQVFPKQVTITKYVLAE